MDLLLTLQAMSPVFLNAGRDAESGDTLHYLQGTSLFGALATAHHQLRSRHREQFADFFLRDRMSMGNAYPATFGQDALQDESKLVAPLPTTARSCKRWSGFRFQSDENHIYHGVSDHLLPWLAFALSNQHDTALLDHAATCPTCGEMMEHFGGYYRRGFESPQIGRSNETVTVHTHTGINRATQTVQQRILYSRQVLTQGSRFQAHVRIDDTIAEDFQHFVEEASDSGFWRIGAARTRGLGLIRQIRCLPLEETIDDTSARIDVFDRKVRQMANDRGIATPYLCYTAITLHSDVLLPDRLLRWRTRIDGETLAGLSLPNATLLYHSARTRRVMSWNSVVGLPRADAIAISRSSVFVYGFETTPDIAAFHELQRRGLGLRREGGFGRLVVADPFHFEVMNA